MTESIENDHTKVIVIGMGLSKDDLTSRHHTIIESADVLIGGKRHLACFGNHAGVKKEISSNVKELTAYIKEHKKTHKIVVLASGDPLLFGIGSVIVYALGPDSVEIYPNISSVSAAFSRIREPWHDARIISMHGKNSEKGLLSAINESRLVAVMTDPTRNPAWIAKLLLSNNLDEVKICVFEQLGTPDEKISWHSIENTAQLTFSEPNIVVLKQDSGFDKPASLHLGMPDNSYEHENGLITKSEIRAVTISKLKLLPHHVLWDLGAGSGSIGIEASLLLHKGKIVAVEKDIKRIQNIEQNRLRYGVNNLEIRQADLLDGLKELPEPDRVFIGGGGINLEKIIISAAKYLKPDGVIVINTVLTDNMTRALNTLNSNGFFTEVIQIQVNRSKEMPWSQRLEAQNPVWIISGDKRMRKK